MSRRDRILLILRAQPQRRRAIYRESISEAQIVAQLAVLGDQTTARSVRMHLRQLEGEGLALEAGIGRDLGELHWHARVLEYDVPCPKCGAARLQLCQSPHSGTPTDYVHSARRGGRKATEALA